MILSGFADEAGDSLDEQIAVTRELGWRYVELRSIDRKNVLDLDDKAFKQCADKLTKAGIKVNCLGSNIANWGTSINDDFAATEKTVDRAIKRMKLLGTEMIRIMSYAILFGSNGKPLADQRAEERIRRLKIICSKFADAGITCVHENCLNYGGMSFSATQQLLDEIPQLMLLFDTGNPCLTPDFSKPEPWPNQNPFEFWKLFSPRIRHVHIKDGWRNPTTGKEEYFMPGEGPCKLEQILETILKAGYQGAFTIEPHIAVVYHNPSVQSSSKQRKTMYIEFARKFETMMSKLEYREEHGSL